MTQNGGGWPERFADVRHFVLFGTWCGKKAVLEGVAVNYNPPGFTRLLVTSHVALYALVSVQG